MKRRTRRALQTVAMLVLLGLAGALPFTASADAASTILIVSPSIADTTSSSTCTAPCALRQAVKQAQNLEEESFGLATVKIELQPGTYALTQGPIRLEHPFESSSKEPEVIEGLAGRASEVVVTAGGKSRVFIDGHSGDTSGLVELKRMKITGGNGEGGIPEPDPNEPELGEGGGIAIEQNGTLTLDEVTVSGNTAASAGGGIEDAGELVLEDSTVAHNTVTGGGGLGLGLGGGISSDNLNAGNHELITILNSTIAENSVTGGTKQLGGGIYSGTSLTITNSTISGNSAPASGGGGLASQEGGGAVAPTLANSIIAYNEGKQCEGATPSSQGGNDVTDTSCGITEQKKSKDISEDPGLEKETEKLPKLTDNGGATETIAIASSGAPVAKNGLEAHCPATDQRGGARPEKAACSSGSFEFGAKPALIYSGSASPAGAGTLTAHSIVKNSECQAASCTVPAGSAGTVIFSASVEAGYALTEWTGCTKVNGSECEVTISSSSGSVTAHFARRFTIEGKSEAKGTTVHAQGSGPAASCAAGSCTVDEGESVTLTAESSAANVQFASWAGGSCTVNPCTVEHVKANESDLANFILGPPPTPPKTLVLYVSKREGDGIGGESPAKALRSVAALEELLAHEEPREEQETPNVEILFEEGTYEGLRFERGRKNVSVYGDLSQGTFKPVNHPAEPTTFTGSPQGLLLDANTGMSFQRVSFRGEAQAGGSTYGVRMIQGSTATFSEVGITAAGAPAGARGANGAAGAPGGNGQNGGPGYTPGDIRGSEAELAAHAGFQGVEVEQLLTCPGVDQHGNWAGNAADLATIYREYSSCGQAPASPSGPREPGDGGAGGYGGWLHGSSGGGRIGDAGSPAIDNGATAASGGAAGPGANAESSFWGENGKSATTPGGAGTHGEQGPQGASQSALQTTAADLYQQGVGASGGAGFSGGGGGGGGGGSGDFDGLTNGAGDNGGSGGAGGWGGEGGAGGSEGGGSFGLYLADHSSAVVDYASELTSGNGGPGGEGASGGAGGAGGSGGKGSAYAASTIGAGSNGGAGGGGGPGGGGGGGAGGPSYAIFGPGETVEEAADTKEHVGSPGRGGYPGGWGGEPAVSGGGGPDQPCSANCKFSPNLPVQLPYSAPVSGGKLVTIPLACAKACHGVLTLSVRLLRGKIASAGHVAAARATQIGRLRFSLRAKRTTSLQVTLNKAGRALVKRFKAIRATLVVEVTAAGARHATKYTHAIEMAPAIKGPPAKKA